MGNKEVHARRELEALHPRDREAENIDGGFLCIVEPAIQRKLSNL